MDCTRSVLAQTYLANYRYAVFNVSPISKAINVYHRRMWKPFSVKVDVDFILHDDCFEKLYKTMLRKGDKYYCVSGLVEDPFFGPIGGIHLYRTSCVKHVVVPDVIGCDRFVAREMDRKGYKFHEIQEVLAQHKVDWSWENVFARYFRAGQKHLYYETRRHEDYVKTMGRKWLEGDRLAFIGLVGYCVGLLTPDDKEKGLGFAKEELDRMRKLIEQGVVPK